MTMQQSSLRAVGTFSSRRDAEAALNQLRESGFPMDNVSVLAKNAENDEQLGGTTINDNKSGEAKEGAGVGAVTGTALGGVTGLLIGLEALLIPGVGPFLAAGTLAATLAGAGIGAAAGGLVGALANLGVSDEDAKGYNDRISQGDYLVTVEGTLDQIERAGMVFQNLGIRNWNIYDVSNRRRYDRGVMPERINPEI